MTWILIPIILLFVFFNLLYAFLGISHLLRCDKYQNIPIQSQELPFFSILLAARNEEKNILACLQSLTNLDYPVEKLQILIGNDGSTDNTEQIIRDFITDKPHFQLINIEKRLGKAQGKANVLAHLAHLAKGDLWLVLDADIEVKPTWVRCYWQFYQQAQNPNLGIMTGFTLIKGTHIFHHWQAFDWLFGLTYIKILSDFKIPLTTLGNNMLVTKQAYWATGGYENIPFSITEDFALFHAITRKGFDFKNYIHVDLMSITQPMPTWASLMHQRKRWMRGALQLPLYMRLLLLAQVMLLPIWCFWASYQFVWACTALLSFILIQTATMALTLKRIQHLELLKYVPTYIFYQTFSNLALIVYYYLPYQIDWKGRKY